MKTIYFHIVITIISVLTVVAPVRAQDVQPKDSAQDDTYTIPQSYYNSLKNLDDNVAHENNLQNVNQNNHVSESTSKLSSNKKESVDKKTDAPLAIDDDGPYIESQIGELRAEIDELRKQIGKDETGVVAGYGASAFLQSKDGNFRLNFNGRIQVRYAFIIAEDHDNGHTLNLRRAFLMFHGHAFNKKAKYFFLLAPNAPSSLVYFTTSYKFIPEFSIYAIHDAFKFTAESSASSAKLMFIGRSLVANRYDGKSMFGIFAVGKVKWFKYSVGVANGLDLGLKSNINNEMAYKARFIFDIINKLSVGESDLAYSEKPGLAIGLGALFGHYETGTQARVMFGTADIRFKYRGFSFLVAGVIRQTDPDQFSRAQYDLGFVSYAGYFVIPKKFEIAVRVATLIDDITNANVNLNMRAGNITRLGGALAGNDVDGDSENEWEYTAGLNYYFHGYNAKIQAQYTLIIDGIAGPDDLVNHIGLFQVQFAF